MTELKEGILLRQGRYRLHEPLGQGGQAEVWAAEEHGPNDVSRNVVIKCINLHDPQHKDPELTKKIMLREARLAARLQHPNIVQIHDVAEEENLLYIVMERIDGCTLQFLSQQALQCTQKPIPWPLVVAILIEICKALHYAHHYTDRDGHLRAVIHRDLKPSNILLSNTGLVKVIDFGIAKSLSKESHDQITLKGHVKGTPAYMAPEQLLNQPLGPYTDLFSLGVVLYELCAGRPPFLGENILRVAAAIIGTSPPPLTRTLPDIPPALQDTLDRLLAKLPKDREDNAGNIQKQLSQIILQAPCCVDQEMLGRYCQIMRSKNPQPPARIEDLAR